MPSTCCITADVEEGGETAFPHSIWLDKEIQTGRKQYSDCTNGGVAVKPKKGDALLFWGLQLNLKHLEAFSFHTGCPVIRGTKWSATKWIHISKFANAESYKTHSNNDGVSGSNVRPCRDKDANCPMWAKAGHCKTRFAHMIGTQDAVGRCRKSCGMCCPPGDVLCERRVNGFVGRANYARKVT